MIQAPDCVIIDDDKNVVEVLKMYLENMGIFRSIISATDGSQASLKLSNQKFALILLDINMPKKSGIDVIKEIKQGSDRMGMNRVESIVVVSGELDKSILAGSMRAGVKHFLIKPFDEDSLVEKVRNVLSVTAPGHL